MRRPIQDLTFETRDLDDFAIMLRAAITVLGGGKLVRVGYRMHQSGSSGGGLFIGLCHIYLAE